MKRTLLIRTRLGVEVSINKLYIIFKPCRNDDYKLFAVRFILMRKYKGVKHVVEIKQYKLAELKEMYEYLRDVYEIHVRLEGDLG